MSKTKYTRSHEWVRSDDDGHLTIGITDFAQAELGDVVYVELPKIGAHIRAGEEAAVIESVKAAAGINMPMAGRVLAVNDALADAPEIVNSEPTSGGWFFSFEPDTAADFETLLDENAYRALIA